MTFRAPVRDIAFALNVAGHGDLVETSFPELDADTVAAVLDAAGAFTTEILAPLNWTGDQAGASHADGKVTAAPGFAEAYRAFAEQGWNSLSAEDEHGGQGLPKAMELAVFEMVHAANMAFGLCPMLTQAAIEALTQHGTERQKRLVLPRLVSGEWTGTMNLTEPQAGSDLAALTTRAEPDGNGGYKLYGQKIFITWGDHDAADNICHLVLARLPDAPPGVKGISLFLATKRLVKDDGALGEANALWAASIEHKLGIHASPTCVMMFDGAQAELVGELNQGLAHMFVMMNAARLQVGVEGVGIAERAFQQALAYAQDRTQGRSAWGGASPAPIYDHPDVRRTLMLMKAKIEAARGVCFMTGVLADHARLAPTPEARASAKARQDLLTPIAKAWSTDVGVEVASLGVQVHGGMGFIEETGAAQHYRDARIGPIYEGTNGIQALDLAGRKLSMGEGSVMDALCAEMAMTAEALTERADLTEAGRRLAQGVAALEAATDWLLKNRGTPSAAGATPYLKLAGDVIGGFVLARQALAAAGSDDPWMQARLPLLRLYAGQVLAGAPGLVAAVTQGAEDLEAVSAAALAG
ncbi:acyl-CoA dehydrogenase [Phenylobacterium sp.]|uniref:acyl-CoA dehydrogenase n=1 Tax=Phenylobacterium sp. TaxID=1871053 RepID=UPI00272F62EB|nr:acyl-CoA dehydrogenase [Phenylobacterium sp.]MDP2214334.1 acyl-CoA dehydrogenase [Phenylobacterium sp.]